MEFWLSYNNGAEKIQLPVNPFFDASRSLKTDTMETVGIGETSVLGKTRLMDIPLESFFPHEYASYCQYTDVLKPYEYTAIIDKWMTLQTPIRLIITDTPINIAVSIESFTHGQRDGSGDVYYSLQLKEYRFYQLKKSIINPKIQSYQTASSNVVVQRKQKKAPNNIYTIKSGDNSFIISKKIFGTSANRKQIELLLTEQGIIGYPVGKQVKI